MGPQQLHTFIITSPAGEVLDMGTFYHLACAEDTGRESPSCRPGNRLTLVSHDDDGSRSNTSSVVLPAAV